MDIALALLAGLALGFLLAHARTTKATAPDLAAPLAHQLDRVQDLLQGLEVSRAASAAELREQVSHVALGNERLSRETRSLVDALRRPQARGRWGELHLRRVVEH